MDFNKSFYELNKEEYNDMNIAEWYDTYNKYKKLEEEIGCPLEIRYKIVSRALIYTDDGSDWTVQTVLDKYFWANCNTEYSNANFSWKDYKKTWWLKKDRSE